MKTFRLLRLTAVLLSVVCLQGCGAAATPPPEPTATDTATVSPTATYRGGVTVIYVKNPPTKTKRPTITRTPGNTPTPTISPTNSCGYVPRGWWSSDETTYMAWMTTPRSMFFFKVGTCEILGLQVFAYPAQGKGFVGDYPNLQKPIVGREFNFSLANPDGPGTLSIYGKFTSNTLCQGFIMFSEGFQVEGYILPAPVTIGYTARV